VFGFNQNSDDNGLEARNDFVFEWRVRLTINTRPDDEFQVCSDVANDWASCEANGASCQKRP